MFVQADMGQLGIGEQRIGNLAAEGCPVLALERSDDDPVVVKGDMGEVGAACTVADSVDPFGARPEMGIDLDVSTASHRDAGRRKPYRVGIRRASRRGENMGSAQLLPTSRTVQPDRHSFSRAAVYRL